MKKIILCLACVWCVGFDLIEMPTQNQSKPKVLIIGGIQGDEPGGFNATNLFLQHYQILKGEVLVIPNLNRESILRNHRGIYGDMNRKFQTLDSKDAQFNTIQRLKNIVLQDDISFIFHLHDGGGFYRQTYINKDLNPNRWGNCSIIDQEKLDGVLYGNLLEIAKNVVENINTKTLNEVHSYRIRNTKTRAGDKEMEKSLTFFAIRNQKPAIANEASKSLPLQERVYYHLLAIEGMLKSVGVEFKRDFDLDPRVVWRLINDTKAYVKITPLVELPLFGLKKKLQYFPLPKDVDLEELALQSNHYILGLLKKKQEVSLKYGNRVMTTFSPLYLEFSSKEPQKVAFEIDGKEVEITLGSMVEVKKNFKILSKDKQEWRVNVIGFYGKKQNEVDEEITLKKMNQNYSIDRRGKKYRVEFYEDKIFLGMVVVDFS